MRKQSFGANLFDLYNDSFLLDSFIGQFAQDRIETIIKKISKAYCEKCVIPSNDLLDVEKTVELIGDPVLKNKLKYMLEKIRMGEEA